MAEDGVGAHLLLAGAPRLALADGRELELPALDALLLAWLALRGPTARERLAALLWPDSAPDAARNALRQRLFRLRRIAGAELVAGNSTLALVPGTSHDLAGAPTLLDGAAVSPIAAAGGELARWLDEERRQRREQARGALEAHIGALEAAGDADAALPLALALVEREPLSEDAHRRVMRLHYLRGDRAAALLAFDRCEQMLKHEVGAQPSAATLELLRLVSGEQARAEPRAVPSAELSTPPPTSPASLVQPTRLPLTLLRPPRLVGRDAELQRLRESWLVGTPLLVQGDAGIGKSRLLQSLSEQEPALASAAGRPGDSLVPYATLSRLLQGLVQRAGAALDGRTRRALVPLLPMLAADGTTGLPSTLTPRLPPSPLSPLAPVRGSLAAAVQALLAEAAPLVGGIVLDDLHFADTATLELLQALLTTPRGSAPPLRWCLGHRPPQPGSALHGLVQALLVAGPCTPIVLRPLHEPALAELVESLHLPGVDADTARAWAPLLRQRSGGNPLFVLETIKSAWNEGRLAAGGVTVVAAMGVVPGAPGAPPRPSSLDQLIAQQLARLSPTALALARLAAVAGVDFSLLLAEALSGLPALQLADPWHELETQQVIVGEGFAHDLIFEAVLAGVPAAIARRLHGQVAGWLESRATQAERASDATPAPAADPARIAAHWERAGEPARALPHLRAAAERAHQALREHERIDFLLRAADIAEARGDASGAYTSVAAALLSHMNTIRDSAGVRLLDRLDTLANTLAQRAEAAGLRAWYAVQLADLPAALTHGRRALALAESLAERPADSLAEPSSNPQLALVIRQRLATALAAAGDFDAALAEFETTAAALARPGVQLADAELAEFHGNHAAVLDNLGRGEAAATQRRLAIAAAIRAGDAAQQVSQLANQAVSQHARGAYSEMADTLAQAQRLITSYEMAGSTVGFVAVLRCQAERALGRFSAALAAADEAERVLGASNPARLPVVHLQRGHVWLDLGQTARALQTLRAAAPGLPPHLEARRCLLLARAEPAQAAAWHERAAAVLPRAGWPEIGLLVPLEATQFRAAAGAGAAGVHGAAPPLLDELERISQQALALGLAGVQRAVLAALFKQGCAAAAAPPPALISAALGQLAEPLPGDGAAAAMAYLAELPWQAARLLAARGLLPEATALRQRLRAWVAQTAADQVPAPFRDSFLQRNAVNRALLGDGWPSA